MLPLQCDTGDYTRVARLRHDFMPDITALIFLHYQVQGSKKTRLMTHRAALETMCPGQGRDYTGLERELCKTFVASEVMSGHAEKKANASQQAAKRKAGVWLSGQPQRNRRDAKYLLDMGFFKGSGAIRNIFSTATGDLNHWGLTGIQASRVGPLLAISVENGSVVVFRAVPAQIGLLSHWRLVAEADKTKWARH